ncbi:unnamed protein product [Strongylus vulgaris]|uniref:Uncharacterized protein n=1 Tax=Strongylus vulgaris TaxID=40348 RepID=A0A3P7LCG6_STRVU|nr:unnamed protein product [Strongylus vulgaris]
MTLNRVHEVSALCRGDLKGVLREEQEDEGRRVGIVVRRSVSQPSGAIKPSFEEGESKLQATETPKEGSRAEAAGEPIIYTKPAGNSNIQFNVEPDASISVNVLGERARAGGGEGEYFTASSSTSDSDTILAGTDNSSTLRASQI